MSIIQISEAKTGQFGTSCYDLSISEGDNLDEAGLFTDQCFEMIIGFDTDADASLDMKMDSKTFSEDLYQKKRHNEVSFEKTGNFY